MKVSSKDDSTDCTMFVKSLEVDQVQGKSAVTKSSGVPKPIKKDGGLKTLPTCDTPYPEEIFDDSGAEPGKFAKSAPSHLMKDFYGARRVGGHHTFGTKDYKMIS